MCIVNFLLSTPDLIFFIAIAVIVVIIVAIYFLIPVIKHKEYAERRANLRKREETFRANLKSLKQEEVTIIEETESSSQEDDKNDGVEE